MIPSVAELDVATAAEARDEAWFGSNTTPAKKPEVTMSVAVRDKVEGHCCGQVVSVYGRGKM